jgi:hypothetical protein
MTRRRRVRERKRRNKERRVFIPLIRMWAEHRTTVPTGGTLRWILKP